jgi:hypothetical protein
MERGLLYSALAYLGVGAVWLFVSENVLPAPATGVLTYPIPLGNATGSVVLWPWAVIDYLMSIAQQGTQSGAVPTGPAANQ